MADGVAVTTAAVPSNISGHLNVTLSTVVHVAKVINWLTFAVGLPAIGLAFYTLRNLSKGQNKVPMNVVFLLISDIISFFGRPQGRQQQTSTSTSTSVTSTTSSSDASPPTDAADFMFNFSVVSNVTLMLFIAQERHVLVAFPRCVLCCGNLRRSPAVALVAWAAPLGVLALAVLHLDFWFATALLAPFPFLLFFAVDSWRALVCSRSNPPTPERRRTVLGLVAIWVNYTVLYGPFVVSMLLDSLGFVQTVQYLGLVAHLLLYLSPLVDPFLYIFMTRGVKDVLQALPCHKKTPPPPAGETPTVETVSESVETIQTVSENVETVQTMSENVQTVQTVSENVQTVQTVSENVQTVQTVSENVQTVQTVSENVETVQTVSENVETVQTVSENVETIETMSENVETVQTVSENVETVQTVSENVETVHTRL